MAPGDRWFFDRVAWFYDLVVPPASVAALQAGVALADGPVVRVIDVGGGTGRASRAIDASDQVVVDTSAGMLRRVPARLDRVLGDAANLPIADRAADAVLIVDALHHMPDHDRVLAEAYRVLRPGGVIVLREFDRGTVRGRLLEAAEHAIQMESTFVTIRELTNRLNRAGFEAFVLEDGFASTIAGQKPGGP